MEPQKLQRDLKVCIIPWTIMDIFLSFKILIKQSPFNENKCAEFLNRESTKILPVGDNGGVGGVIAYLGKGVRIL